MKKAKKIKFNKKVFKTIMFSLLAIILAAAVVTSSVLYFGGKIDYSKGFDQDNNGCDLYSDEVSRLISVVPNENQVVYSDMEYYNFIHYGMNTFTGQEWGDGTEDPSLFNPEVVDTDQWARVLKESGSSGIILTAKHHDGFCLFQTAYTEHSIKNSPYQDGKGDIVKQVADSCRKYGLKFGIYLSPWDRNNPDYGTEAYNDFFVNQLTELCTNYGDIFCFWFDGAKGEDVEDFDYDFDRYFEVIHELQPNAVTAICGDDVRWIGNEGGDTRESEWSVVARGTADIENTMNNSQKSEDQSSDMQEINDMDKDLGSRDLVKNYSELKWYPAESDISIHNPNWFYTEDAKIRSAKELANVYFKVVGGNASMLLNVPPSKNGIIEPEDEAVLKEFKSIIDETFANKLDYTVTNKNDEAVSSNITQIEGSYMLQAEDSTLTFKFDGKQKVKTIVLQEDITQSQRVEGFEIYAKVPGGYKKIHTGTVIGSKCIVRLSFPFVRNTDEIKIIFTQSRSNPVIRNIQFYS